MKKLLTKAIMTLFLVTGVFLPSEAVADTSLLTTANGWTKITSLPSDLDNYYFVFVDNTQDLMLSFGDGPEQSTDNAYKTMVYRTSEDAAMNPLLLWEISTNSSGGWSIKNATEPTYYQQTEWNAGWYCRTHDNGGGDASWYNWTIAYADGSWTIQNGKYPDAGYVGPWVDAAFLNGREVAANKTGNNVGHFQIYAIQRADVNWIGNASESRPANLTYKITNPNAVRNTNGWTMGGGTGRNSGTGTFDGAAGFFEPSQWGWNDFNLEMSQTITGLPTGKFRLRAAIQSSNQCTVTLKANDTASEAFLGNGASGGNILQDGKETTDGNGVAGWMWRTLDFVESTGTVKIAFNTITSQTHNWANVDNVELYYLGPVTDKAGLLAQLESLLASCAPYNDVVDASEYTIHYNLYATYSESNTVNELQTAVDYLTENYPVYQWANASMTHPVDVTVGIIGNWECTANDAWPGSGRTMGTGTYYDGSSRTYFTQNHESGAARSQSVTIPNTGAYLLRTIVRPVSDAAYATISIGSESTTTRGQQTGSNNIGNGWGYNDIYFYQSVANEAKTISINLSNVNVGREADCGEMHLLYIGQSVDFVKDGVHRYIGEFATAPTIVLTDDVPVANTTAATLSGATVTFTNPNGLVFAQTGQVTASKNVIINNVCANLELVCGHPFVNPTAFVATDAKYTMGSGELAGGSCATLILPFTASSLPGNAYTLDKGINLIEGKIRGTSVSTIPANSPVVVKASGNYRGANTEVPVVSAGTTFTNGELIGTYTAMTAVESSYVLQNHTLGEGVAFYLVGSTKPTVKPFRAYIKEQAYNVKALAFDFDEETAINGIGMANDTITEVYTIDGVRATSLKKGINIVKTNNGTIKKVYIK